jgi:hypothetical protein
MEKSPTSSDQSNLPCSSDRDMEQAREPMCSLHMLIPVSVRRKAKLASVVSGVSFRDYVAHLLSHARPLETGGCEGENATPNASNDS